MLKIINLSQQKPNLSQISTIKHILPMKNNTIIIIGHSAQSLKSLQFLFQIYDFESKQVLIIGRIDAFGVRFLSEYVAFKQDGQYINVVLASGKKIIKLYDFPNGITQNYIKSIQSKQFQEAPSKKQSYYLHYASKVQKIVLIEGFLYEYQYQILVRVFQKQNQVNQYRIILLETQIPNVYFSDDSFAIVTNSGQLSLYKCSLQSKYYHLANLQSFSIVSLHHQLIVKFKDNNSIFKMSFDGGLKSLVDEQVLSIYCNNNYIYCIIEKQLVEKLEVYQYVDIGFVKKYEKELEGKGYKLVGCDKSQILMEKR